MDYEKAYKEALERARKIHSEIVNNELLGFPGQIEDIFPQLRESEDEKIRKEIIDIVEAYRANCVYEGTHRFDDCLAWLEKQKEQKPIEMEVYEVGKGTTICCQDYKCKKDYKEGNCWYIKDVIYHCGRDGYLTDQNGVSWSCTPEWFNEYIYTNSEWADKEKNDFVSGQFIRCKLSFDEFKEGEHYWFEYVGDDTYVGRSDNILNQKFHITPRQLYSLFSQQLVYSPFSQQLEENEKEPKQNPLLEVFGFKVGDAVRLKDGDGRKHIIKSFEEVEGLHGPNFYHVEFEDNSARDSIYPGEEYPNGYYTQMEKIEEERSLEDDHIIGFVYDLLNEIEWKDDWAMSKEECLRRLNNYRPSWKPSEEQMNEMEFVINDYREDGCNRVADCLQEILEQMKKL